MKQFRSTTGGIPVEVNDNGDTIEIRVDAAFEKALTGADATMKRVRAELKNAMDNPDTPQTVIEALIDSQYAETDAAIDAMFGEGACEKIFPTGSRSFGQYDDLFSFIIECVDEVQNKSVAKYKKQR